MLHLEELVCRSLNVLADLMAVSGSIKKRPQNEHVQSSLEKSDPMLCMFHHGRNPTVTLAGIVDTRLSNVKEHSGMQILGSRCTG